MIQATTHRRAARVPGSLLAAIAAAWGLAILAEATGRGASLHHDALIHSGLPLWIALGLFLVAWQAMIAAMMLPSSLPLIRLFGTAARDQDRPGAATAGLIGGYAVVWSAFGALAFLGDAVLHRIVDATPWLKASPWLIAGGVLALAGLFQFSNLKERCLSECRHPAAYLLRHYRRGVGEAFKLGGKHGLFCLGCCWALMLVMFAAGVANLWWMAALTAVMVYEKVGRGGDRVVPIVGFALLALAGLTLLHPSWLPSVLGGQAT